MGQIDSLWTIATDRQLDSISNRVDSIQNQLDALQLKSNVLWDIIATSNNSISNQLTTAGIVLALFAIIISIGGAILGFYVRKRKNEIDTMSKIIEKKKQIMDAVAEATINLDRQINSDIKGLYKQLRKEETNTLLDRLVLEPRDISNLLHLLLARDLEDNGFQKIREAYLKYMATKDEDNKKETENDIKGVFTFLINNSYDEKYLLLFFQHYCYQALKDDDIRPELTKRLKEMCNYAFKRDIIKSTLDICKALSDEESTFNKEDVLVTYLKALDESVHRNLLDLKNIMEQNITPQTLLRNAIERCKEENVFLVLFET